MNGKYSKLILCFFGLLVVTPALCAQAAYTATRSGQIQAGVGLLYLNPDYKLSKTEGVSFWADYDFYKFIGVEATVHLADIVTPDDIAENSYLIGPRFVYRRKRLTGYAKLLVGRASIIDQISGASSSYNVIGYGGGVEYRVLHRINIRAIDAELQKWPDFQPHTLSPIALSFGVSYIIR